MDFRNTVIILTSNIGSQYILNEENDEQREAMVTEALRSHFRPEFLNRIDEIIIFDRLKRDEITTIVDLQLDRVRKRRDVVRVLVTGGQLLGSGAEVRKATLTINLVRKKERKHKPS